MSSTDLCVALSLVFGILVLILVAQLYYFLWWKKRKHLDIEMGIVGKYSKGFSYWRCWKKPSSSVHDDATNTAGFWQPQAVARDPETPGQCVSDLESGVGDKDLVLKPYGEESVEIELMRLHNLSGPPRFLFTITEETKEDLESEDGSMKGSRTMSLSDFMDSPLASSPLKCSLDNLDHPFKQQGFNPLFESAAESEFNRFRSSPPPKFKFLREAEDKLYRKLIEEARRKALENHGQDKDSSDATMAADGSFLRIIQNKDKDRKQQVQQFLPHFPSSSPLAIFSNNIQTA